MIGGVLAVLGLTVGMYLFSGPDGGSIGLFLAAFLGGAGWTLDYLLHEERRERRRKRS